MHDLHRRRAIKKIIQNIAKRKSKNRLKNVLAVGEQDQQLYWLLGNIPAIRRNQ